VWRTIKSVQLPTAADNVTLLAFAAARRAAAAPGGHRYRSIPPARRAHSSKPATAACSGRWPGQTDGHRTVTETLAVASYASSVKNTDVKFLQDSMCRKSLKSVDFCVSH